MGAYTYLTAEEFKRFSVIENDEELNEILQEARSLVPKIYVGTKSYEIQTWFGFGKIETVTHYSLYSRVSDEDDGTGEVHVLNLKTQNRDYVANYLFGLMNGYRACIADSINK